MISEVHPVGNLSSSSAISMPFQVERLVLLGAGLASRGDGISWRVVCTAAEKIFELNELLRPECPPLIVLRIRSFRGC